MKTVKWNKWRDLELPSGSDVPRSKVSVIIPARTGQEQLDICLAALAGQDYPADLMEVIVVDHGSIPALRLPEWVSQGYRIVRHEEGKGPGAARAAGADQAQGEILMFMDSDIIASRSMVANYVKWPAVLEEALVLGFRDFIDPVGLTADDVRSHAEEGNLEELLFPRLGQEGQDWIDNFLKRSDDNQANREDLWNIVVGAGLALSRRFYDYIGGFRDFRVHGIEDTEFGFRVFQGGGVIIPDRACHGYHLGLRAMSVSGEKIKRDRRGLLANYIAHDRSRPRLANAVWQVPKVRAQIIALPGDSFETIHSTADDLLASSFTDLSIEIFSQDSMATMELAEYYSANSRVAVLEGRPVSGFPSPFTLRVAPGVKLAKDSVDKILKDALADPKGVVAYVVNNDGVSLEFWRTRALSRAGFSSAVSSGDESRQFVREMFGETWKSGEEADISRPLEEVVASIGASRGVRE